MPQGENRKVIICSDSGLLLMKSNCRSAFWILVMGSGLKEWIKSGNLIESLIKNIFKLFPTRSQLPSSVYIFTAKPLGSRKVSGECFPWITVENLTKTGVFLSVLVKTFALVYLLIGSSPTLP